MARTRTRTRRPTATPASSDEPGKLIVGLGNPGERYRDTRHNLGFRVVDALAGRLGTKPPALECNALVRRGPGVLLAAPQTYMNRSGYAVRCLLERHRISPADVLVVYDEVALPLGRLRLRAKGGPGGHRGMESVIRSLDSDQVARLRMGVAPDGDGPGGDDLSDYVLAPFEHAEKDTVEEMISAAAEACTVWMEEGAEAVMNTFNRGEV